MKPDRRKKRGKTGRAGVPGTLLADFARGFVATGLLSVIQDRSSRPATLLDRRRALRHALQGGAALAAGSAAAQALQAQDGPRALGAVAGGAAAILTIEYLLRATAQPALQEN